MSRRQPLPPELHASAFLTRDALTAGSPPSRLRAKHLERSVWGVRAVSPANDHASRSRLVLLRSPDSFLSHTSAAKMWRIPLPPALDASTVVELAVRSPARAPHARGIRGHSIAVDDSEIVEIDGLRCTDARRTWFDLGGMLALPDLVAVGDSIVSRRIETRVDLADYVEPRSGARGTTRLRTAASVVSMRSESPQESRLRTIMLMQGLPEPAVNHEIVFLAEVVARVDLAYVAQRVAIEYQGDYHRDQKQWRADLTRRVVIENAGWTVVEVGAADLSEPAAMIARLRRLLADR